MNTLRGKRVGSVVLAVVLLLAVLYSIPSLVHLSGNDIISSVFRITGFASLNPESVVLQNQTVLSSANFTNISVIAYSSSGAPFTVSLWLENNGSWSFFNNATISNQTSQSSPVSVFFSVPSTQTFSNFTINATSSKQLSCSSVNSTSCSPYNQTICSNFTVVNDNCTSSTVCTPIELNSSFGNQTNSTGLNQTCSVIKSCSPFNQTVQKCTTSQVSNCTTTTTTSCNSVSMYTQPAKKQNPNITVSIVSSENFVVRGEIFNVSAVVTNTGADATSSVINWALPSYLEIVNGKASQNLGAIPSGKSKTYVITLNSTLSAFLGNSSISAEVDYE